MKPKHKLDRIMGVTGWTRDHMADLLGVSNMAFRMWLNGRSQPHEASVRKIDAMYEGIVKPLECEIDRLSDAVEKKILKDKIKDLDTDNCPA